jgi:HEAT repeat protein
VRREAFRLLFRDPAERTRALCTALSDAEPGIQRLALASAAEGGCPDPAVPLVVTIASDSDQDSDVRVGAIRVLAARGGGLALDALLRLTEIRRRSIFDAMRSTAMPAEFLAALAALGAFHGDRRARERLEAALRLRDPVVHKVAAEAMKGMG